MMPTLLIRVSERGVQDISMQVSPDSPNITGDTIAAGRFMEKIADVIEHLDSVAQMIPIAEGPHGAD